MMSIRKSTFQHLAIDGLFGDRDVSIPFNEDVKILVGENGLGKTTVLNMLYYLLTGRVSKLRDFEFNTLRLTFEDSEPIVVEKSQIVEPDSISDDIPPRIYDRLLSSISAAELDELFHLVKQSDSRQLNYFIRENSYFQKILGHYPPSVVKKMLYKILDNEDIQRVGFQKQTVATHLKGSEILYFPTFRRIEEDLINLGFDNDQTKINPKDNRLIHFGMRDVKERFEELKREINNLASKGLSEISTEILSQLIRGLPALDSSVLSTIQKKDVDIILARVGEAISKDDKEKIANIISSQQWKKDDDRYLTYFLQKLVAIYEDQRELDEDIESFVSVCNSYLTFSNKEIQYEASEVQFYLVSNGGPRVELTKLLSKLSSGEKQIISLFSRLYLSKNKNFIVLFDEPELSLSIFWQKLLLPSIIDSGKCKFLLSVTHSPFIFDNALDKCAIGLSQYIKFYNNDANR